MSTTFCVPGLLDESINLASVHARDLLVWLGYNFDDYSQGTLDARDLAARCKRRLWEEKRNHDPARPGETTQDPGCARLIVCARPEGYLRARAGELLALAEKAGAEPVRFH